MARKWSNLNLPGALHYVTGNCINRIPVFRNSKCCETFLKELASLRRTWPSKLIAYVVMPDHFHLIVNPKDGRIREFARDLKSRAAKAILKIAPYLDFPTADGSREVWQASFKAIPLWSAFMIRQKINYIHQNPLKAGLVRSAKDYRWSSFNAFYSQTDKPIPVDQDWWWPDDAEKLSKATKELGWFDFNKRRGDDNS